MINFVKNDIHEMSSNKKMFKVKFLIALLLVIIATFNIIAICATNICINVDGKNIVFTQDSGAPFIDSNNRTLVPLRITMENCGANVEWDSINRIAKVSKSGTIVQVPLNKEYILINGEKTEIDTKSILVNNRTYLPIRAVLEAFGASVEWNNYTKTVIIKNMQVNIATQNYDDVLYFDKKLQKEFKRSEADKVWDISNANDESVIAAYYDNCGLLVFYGEGEIANFEAAYMDEKMYFLESDKETIDGKEKRKMYYLPWTTEEYSIKKVATNNFKPSGSIEYLFSHLNYLEEIDLQGMDTSNVTNMKGLFYECKTLKNVDISSFKTDKVINMKGMFSACNALEKIDLSSLNTKNVTSMAGMFSNCTTLKTIDLNCLNTQNVTDMMSMFAGCSELLEFKMSKMNTSNVKNMALMFSDCENLKELTFKKFNTSNVTNMTGMFMGCSSLKSITMESFNTSKVTSMAGMFYQCTELEKVSVGKFETKNVTDMSAMFSECQKLEKLDLNNFDTRNVTKMSSMFYNCSSLKELKISNFDLGNVTDMSYMFFSCSSLKELGIRKFDTSNVAKTSYMFYGATYLEEKYLND